ncbi:MAG: putative bifunctional diguanylate cyclase/phosphodiesterase [Myxococcaceae bacterium]
MTSQVQKSEMPGLVTAAAVGLPTLLMVWFLPLGLRTRAFGLPWAKQPPTPELLGLMVLVLFAVLAGLFMTRGLLSRHDVLTPTRRRVLTLSYALLTLQAVAELWMPFFNAGVWAVLAPFLWAGRFASVPAVAFLASSYASLYRAVEERLTNERQLSARLYQQSTTDALTGLPNRVAFHELLDAALVSARRTGTAVAVFFIDLDRFKLVNDSLGHEVGDALLAEMARRMRECLRDGDAVCRMGGDEFLAFASELSADGIEAPRLTSRLVEELSRPVLVSGREIVCTASIGVSVFPQDAQTFEALIRHADEAMYAAKDRGRNLFTRFKPEMGRMTNTRLELELELRQALRGQELKLQYQPQVESETGKVVAVEALVRWESPRRGRLGPKDFIAVAEDSALIVEIDRWVLHTACTQLRRWRDAGHPALRVSVNLSARNFHRGDVVATVYEALTVSGLPGSALDLEITESTLMREGDSTLSALRALKALGCTVALDDFGTGYSALGYLNRFPVDSLKIDRALISDVRISPGASAVTSAIVAIGRMMNLLVVAEGVETEAQLAFLKSLGCPLIQGFVFSEPVDADKVPELLGQALTTRPPVRALRQVS